MPKASKSTQCIEKVLSEESDQEETSSDQEVFYPQPSTSNKTREMPGMNMYMPYIEGPSMDWTVNDNHYNRFLKWKLKCKNILKCELAMLPEARKCKKIEAWSGDFGLDQYISWNLSNEELTLKVIWKTNLTNFVNHRQMN